MERYTKSFREPPKSKNHFHKNSSLNCPLRITNNHIKQLANSALLSE